MHCLPIGYMGLPCHKRLLMWWIGSWTVKSNGGLSSSAGPWALLLYLLPEAEAVKLSLSLCIYVRWQTDGKASSSNMGWPFSNSCR